MQALVARELERFQGEWAETVAGAIDRIADEQPLTYRDILSLDLLGDKAHKPAAHAIKFLTFWLDNPDARNRRRASDLKPCVNILLRYPEQAKQIGLQFQQALKNPRSLFSDPDRVELERLSAFISDLLD